MAGNFTGYRRAGSSGMAARLQPNRPRRHDWLMAVPIPLLAICGVLLVACCIIFILMRQVLSTESAASAASVVVDNHSYRRKEREPDERCPGLRCLQTVAQLPEAQKRGPETVVQAPHEQRLGREESGLTLPQLALPDDVADNVDLKFWLNGAGVNAATLWSEEFGSLGMDRFIWFTADTTPTFAEGFPRLLELRRKQNVRLPGWVKTPNPLCSWVSTADLTKDFTSSMTARCPRVVVQQPEAQKPELETVANPKARKPGPETAALPPQEQNSEGQNSGREAGRSALPSLILPDDVARKVGHRIWLNETGGNTDAITSWNANEEFASLGIGHFIWFPASKTPIFEESFPRLLEFLRKQNAHLPDWVDKTPIPPCPWSSRADFIKHFNSPETVQLRKFLLDTVAGQTQFLVMRAQGAMDKILDNTPEGVERQHIITQFARITHASKDLYPLIDYINFKGEGTNPAETAPDKQTGVRQGWGLKQVLLKMNGTTNEPTAVLAEFADAAQSVLLQRIRNIPANRVWEAGWSGRVATYRRPISDPESDPKGVRKEPSHKGG
jgi:hypothetical protein